MITFSPQSLLRSSPDRNYFPQQSPATATTTNNNSNINNNNNNNSLLDDLFGSATSNGTASPAKPPPSAAEDDFDPRAGESSETKADFGNFAAAFNKEPSEPTA